MMRRVLAGLVLCGAGLGAVPAAGETITAKCGGDDNGKPYEMTLVYAGDASGTLTISGTFGDMSFRAGKRVRDSEVAGEAIHATQFWGGAEVPLIVPDKAAIEACVRGKLPPDQLTDVDMVSITIPGCAASAPPVAQPIPVEVYAEVTFLDPETVFVSFKRTYLDKTDLPEGQLVLELLPPPQCTIEE